MPLDSKCSSYRVSKQHLSVSAQQQSKGQVQLVHCTFAGACQLLLLCASIGASRQCYFVPVLAADTEFVCHTDIAEELPDASINRAPMPDACSRGLCYVLGLGVHRLSCAHFKQL